MKRHDLLTGIVVGLLGFAGNWQNIDLLFDLNFLFGSIFVLLGIIRFGPVSGAISGFIAGSSTYFLWGHPWALVVFTGEALFVGWRIKRHGNTLLAADILFWLVAGAPMLWIFYHQFISMTDQATVLIILKQSINGIFNALLASLLQLVLQRKSYTFAPPLSLRDLMFVAMVSLVLIPSFFVILFDLKKEITRGRQQLIDRTATTTDNARKALSHWLADHRPPRGTDVSDQLQGQDLRSASVANSSSIMNMMSVISANANVEVTILDRNRHVVVSTRTDLKKFQPFHRKGTGREQRVDEGVTHWIPAPEKGAIFVQEWQTSTFEKQLPLDTIPGWSVVCETTLLPLLGHLSTEIIRSFAILGLIVVMTVTLSSFISTRLVKGLIQLKDITHGSPDRFLSENTLLTWPDSAIGDISALSNNFRQMASSLRTNFLKLSALNQELETKMEQRKQIEADLLEYHQKLENMTVELSMAEERERCRIAGELHDHVGQRLILGKIKLDALATKLASSDVSPEIESIDELIDQSIQDIRSLTFQLRPPLLASAGFEAALHWLAEEFRENFGVNIAIHGNLDPGQLQYEVRSTLFQMVRELLLNVIKHAKTTSAKVVMKHYFEQFVITVEDKGAGFDTGTPGMMTTKKGGFGLLNIRQKCEYLGGECILVSSPGSGTCATIILPVVNMRGAD